MQIMVSEGFQCGRASKVNNGGGSWQLRHRWQGTMGYSKKAEDSENQKEMQWIPDEHLFNIGLRQSSTNKWLRREAGR
jgi:hypothetical protein